MARKRRTPNKKQVRSKRLSSKDFVAAFREMLRSRLSDLKIITLYKQNKCHFQIGASGHEAVQVAAGMVFRPGKDWFYPYYRDMALCAALGMTTEEFMLNAMNKQDDPNSHGRQMPMHWGHKQLRIVSQSSPTGTQFLQSVGCALAVQKRKAKEVVYVSAGEGTCAQGGFHEALNWAGRRKLPLVFLIENNKYAISVPISEEIASDSVAELAQGYENLARIEIDGTDFIASYEAFRLAHTRALLGKGPTLIEAHVPRLQSHSISDNQLKYRSASELEQDKRRCPIESMRRFLLRKKYATKQELKQLEEKLRNEVDNSSEAADAKPNPDPARAEEHTLTPFNPSLSVEERPVAGPEVYMVDALNHALKEEMAHNPDMYIFGQDVARGKGGVFGVTVGLTDQFGEERVFNAPLAEASILGVSIGMATDGLKPVSEIQFGDYIWPGTNQTRNELAMMNYRSGGDFTCPAVIRVAVGGYIHGGGYHSQNIEATFGHFPGVLVVYPSNATDAKGLLKAAIRSTDPVLFLEHKGLYRQPHAKGPEGGADDLIPIGKAKIVREGDDLTIVCWGALVHRSLQVAGLLSQEGYELEVIDLRSIVPLDFDTVVTSVRKSSRLLIAHEDVLFMGFGAEIAAQVANSCFEHLDAPIERVGMKNVASVPHSPILEEVILPQESDVLAAARKVLMY